ncbi:MAG: molybdopterin molybdotransferase MoeA, partial [Pyrinomonadaceae bacterium]
VDLLGIETIPLEDAYTRILAEEVHADCDLPPFDRAIMDGFALRASDITNTTTSRSVILDVVGESAAGRPWNGRLHHGEAVKIMTGAVVPAGADSVQQIELTRPGPTDAVEILKPVTRGQFITPRASQITAGALLAGHGELIGSGMIHCLAAFGYSNIKVGRRPKLAVIGTGSELVSVDTQPSDAQIRDSNSYVIEAYARAAGAIVERFPLVIDDQHELRKMIDKACDRSDMVIISGGSSVGDYDFTAPALQLFKAKIFFDRVRLRPGKPTIFAEIKRRGDRTIIFGLPGNPVSVTVTFNLFVRTALRLMQGAKDALPEEESAILASEVKALAKRDSYLPAQIRSEDDGRSIVIPSRWTGSSDFVSAHSANGLIFIPAGNGVIEAGAIVKTIRLPH